MYKSPREIFEGNKECFSNWEIDTISKCIYDIEYQERFPEDMIESRTDWDELRDQLESAHYSVKYLLDVIDRLTAKDKTVKTKGDYLRMAWSKDDDKSLADRYITYINNPNPRSPQYYSELLNKYFFSKKQALEANLEYLKQEYKG